MALAQKLNLRSSQSLQLTPQLQQAIHLLQLNNLELAAFIEDQQLDNPLLEVEPSAREAPVNTHIGQGQSYQGHSEFDRLAGQAEQRSLREVLLEQLTQSFKPSIERFIGVYLIGHVDEAGYLQADIDIVARQLNVPVARVQVVLSCLQTFEPVGVCTRSLQECLRLQLQEYGEIDAPMDTLLNHLDLLACHDMNRLQKLCALPVSELRHYIARIKTLSPKPGLVYSNGAVATITPDILVCKLPQGGWSVELNTSNLPHVLVNNRYYDEISLTHKDGAVRNFINECRQNANWLMRALDQRARTILKVSGEIVRQQEGFLSHGTDYLRPLTLRVVADRVGLHESTVSRVSAHKFMETPRGIFELKYFFNAMIASSQGDESLSAEMVRQRIKALIAQENVKTVHSDEALVCLLHAEGISIARRTVAKYRESLNIPASGQRRRILKFRA